LPGPQVNAGKDFHGHRMSVCGGFVSS
jgi:hypothetical protein